MNSRERLMLALDRKSTDRVPISTYELVGYNSKAFENNDQSYMKLMDYIRKKTDCVCMWEPNSNITFLESSYPIDVENVNINQDNRCISKQIFHTPKGDLTRVTETIDDIHTVWEVEHLCKDIHDVEKALSVPFEPLIYNNDDYDRIKKEVSNNGIVMTSIADPLWMAAGLMNFENYLIMAMTETEYFEKLIKTMHERCMENLCAMLKTNLVDLYRICGPEYSTPPYLPPVFFERFVVPYVSEMVELIHSKGSKVRLHCHGKIGNVLNMILDTGADAIDPCEAQPDGDISFSEVKKKVGDKMCIFGNVQLKLLELGDLKDVKITVEKCMNDCKDGGGYVIMPTASPINSPLSRNAEDNYLCFIETALELGKY